MADSRTVLGVLQDARELVRDDWGSGNPDVLDIGAHCTSVAIRRASGLHSTEPICMAAHAAILHAVGVVAPDDVDGLLERVFQFNDAQTSRKPVLAAFDTAIANLESEQATPNADAALEIMAACDRAGEIIARRIVSECPGMDEGEIAKLTSAELFYAAQDTARVARFTVSA